MPVSDPDVVDGIGVDQENDTVLMQMTEARDWSDPVAQVRDLQNKTNAYIKFVSGGQIDEITAFRGRPIEFQVFFQFLPPAECNAIFRALEAHLAEMKIRFRAFHGASLQSPTIDWTQ